MIGAAQDFTAIEPEQEYKSRKDCIMADNTNSTSALADNKTALDLLQRVSSEIQDFAARIRFLSDAIADAVDDVSGVGEHEREALDKVLCFAAIVKDITATISTKAEAIEVTGYNLRRVGRSKLAPV